MIEHEPLLGVSVYKIDARRQLRCRNQNIVDELLLRNCPDPGVEFWPDQKLRIRFPLHHMTHAFENWVGRQGGQIIGHGWLS